MGRSATTLAYSGMLQLAGAVSGILLARSLGVEGRGLLGQLQVWPMMLGALTLLGLFDAAIHRIARRPVPEHASAILGSALFVVSVASSAAVVVSLAAVHYLGVGGDARVPAFAFAFFPLPSMSALVAMATMMGMGDLPSFNRLRVATVLLPAAFFLVAHAFGRLTIGLAVVGVLAANIVVLLVALWRLHYLGVHVGRPERAHVRGLLHYGMRAHAGSISTVLNERLDQLLMSVLISPGALGLYVTAVTATSPVALVGSSQSFLALSDTSSGAAHEDEHFRRQLFRHHLGVTTALSLVAGGIAYPLLPFVIPWLFGAGFDAAVPVARILVLATVAVNIARVGGALLRGVGRPLAPALAEGAAAVVTVLLLLLLLGRLGIAGAAIASAGAYTTAAVIVLFFLRASVRVRHQWR